MRRLVIARTRAERIELVTIVLSVIASAVAVLLGI